MEEKEEVGPTRGLLAWPMSRDEHHALICRRRTHHGTVRRPCLNRGEDEKKTREKEKRREKENQACAGE